MTPLSVVLDETIAQLAALRHDPIIRTMIDADNPEHLRDVAELTNRVSAIFDALPYEIAIQGEIASRDQRSVYRFVVSDAICGNLDFELRDKADRIEEEYPVAAE